MNITFKRWVHWPHSPHEKRRTMSGSVKYDVTLNDVVVRLLELSATQVSIALDFDETQMRPDGWPRANAVPKSPGVLLVVECRNGPLLLACDTYNHWLHNLNAIAQLLNNIRQASNSDIISANDLYGLFRWKGLNQWLENKPFAADLSHLRIASLGKGKWASTTRIADEWASSRPTEPPPPRNPPPPKNPPPPPPRSSPNETFNTRAKAAAWLADKTGALPNLLLSDERTFLEAYRLAARTMHPDVGGDPAQFRRLQNAKSLIERGAPWTK